MQHAKTCFKTHDYPRSLASFSLLSQKFPTHKKIIFQLAFSLYRLGEIDASVSVLSGLIKSDPQFAEAHWLMSLCSVKTGKKNDALVSIFRALTEKPEDQRFRKTLASLS